MLFILVGTVIFLFFRQSSRTSEQQLISDYVLARTSQSIPDQLQPGKTYQAAIYVPILEPSVMELAMQSVHHDNDSLETRKEETIQELQGNVSAVVKRLKSLQNKIQQAHPTYLELKASVEAANQKKLQNANPEVVRQFKRVINANKRYEQNFNFLQELLSKSIAYFESWAENPKQEKPQENFPELFRNNEREFSQVNQRIAKRLYLFEYIYNQKRHELKNDEMATKELDDFYIELQDFMYDKVILNDANKYIQRIISPHLPGIIEETESTISQIDLLYEIDDYQRKGNISLQKLEEELQALNAFYEASGLTFNSPLTIEALSSQDNPLTLVTENASQMERVNAKYKLKVQITAQNSGHHEAPLRLSGLFNKGKKEIKFADKLIKTVTVE
ncbi:hypothetical protein AAG747_20105 [Rapidithrix thailandica]|uniref:Uncharacterized protein n=1 Tax=Rapidithrix thailandica TaxID=413964 RepID=A0AAW9SG40_9BACT